MVRVYKDDRQKYSRGVTQVVLQNYDWCCQAFSFLSANDNLPNCIFQGVKKMSFGWPVNGLVQSLYCI